MVRRLMINAFSLDANYNRGVHQARLPFDVTLDDILVPSFWGQVANNLRPGSIIEAFRPDYSLDMQLRVTAVEKGMAQVHMISGYYRKENEEKVEALRAQSAETKVAIETVVPPELAADYKIGYSPSGFYVQFKVSKETIYSKLPTKADAINKALDHMKRAAGVTA